MRRVASRARSERPIETSAENRETEKPRRRGAATDVRVQVHELQVVGHAAQRAEEAVGRLGQRAQHGHLDAREVRHLGRRGRRVGALEVRRLDVSVVGVRRSFVARRRHAQMRVTARRGFVVVRFKRAIDP